MSRVRLGDVAKEHKETCKGDKGDYPIVGLEHLEPECITLSQWSESTDNTFSKVFRKGHVLFGRRRAYLKKAAVAPFDGICSGDITVIEAIPGRIIPELLPFVIQNDALFDFAVGRSAGSLSPRVKWEHLKNYEFELPISEEEQRKLADVLWSIEQTRKSYNSLLRATDELVKSQFIELFGNCKNLVRIGDVFETRSGGTPSSKIKEYYEGGDIPWLTSGEVNKGIIETTENYITQEGYMNSSAKWIPENTVVVAMYGATAGKVGLVKIPTTTNQAVCGILPHDEYTPEYSYFAIKMMESWMLSKVAGAAQPNISQQIIKEMRIASPPKSQQVHFSAFVQQLDKSKYAGCWIENRAAA